ncbi:MAG: hypothetical protein IIV72_04230, partial [Alistipes sp.]|nr:hypothetical protein [Alistipes sp.]
ALLSTIGNLEKLGKLVILCHIPKLIKFLKLTKLSTLTFPNRTVFIRALICCQKVVAPSLILAPFVVRKA